VNRVTIQYFDECAHWKLADGRVQQVLRDLSRTDVKVEHQRIESPEQAARTGFHGRQRSWSTAAIHLRRAPSPWG